MGNDMTEPIPSLEDRVTTLEELVSYQQHLLQQLNDVIVTMQSSIDQVDKNTVTKIDRLNWLINNPQSDDLPHEKPPHY